jgi:diaminopimelate epimerase
MKFTKMHGLGNDYVYVNCFDQKVTRPSELAKAVSDRHTGIGSDGLILIEPSQIADVRMRIFNADGSEAEMCGNGLRCVGKYSYEHGLADSRGPFFLPGHDATDFDASLAIETGNGVLLVGLNANSQNKVDLVCVNMDKPVLSPSQIPVSLPGTEVINVPIEVENQTFLITCVSMGNPHVVIFVQDISSIHLERLGSALEQHHLFPNRTNVHFVQIESAEAFQVRTWERGSGITLACGTGACACCVAAVLTNQTKRACIAHLPGGDLTLTWSEIDNHVYMTGPAVEVFQGKWQ